MIDITKLYCGSSTFADGLRYGEKSENNYFKQERSARERKPIVVWNITRTCNLSCIHCYSNSENIVYHDELNHSQALKVIDNLAEYGVPAVLFSGGEPLIRKDIFELADYTRSKNLKFVLSTNGTLITKSLAKKIKETGFSYVGISLDGIGSVNDTFRGARGAFEKTMNAFRLLKEQNQRVGLRMTLTKNNINELEAIFDFIETEKIDRACFYHLVYAGRGDKTADITKNESRNAIEIILKRTKDYKNRGLDINILTVDNHVDGVYIYLKLLKDAPEQAKGVYEKLIWNGGGMYSSGVGIGAIDPEGNVHPDQFWQHYNLGNIKDRNFSEIWQDTSDPVLKGLKNRKHLLKGKCSRCKWVDLCGGSLRVRADLFYNDPWMEDPACYLTEEEIS
ncbi:MAG: radical SAM protein [Cyanobacteriota bacterium]